MPPFSVPRTTSTPFGRLARTLRELTASRTFVQLIKSAFRSMRGCRRRLRNHRIAGCKLQTSVIAVPDSNIPCERGGHSTPRAQLKSTSRQSQPKSAAMATFRNDERPAAGQGVAGGDPQNAAGRGSAPKGGPRFFCDRFSGNERRETAGGDNVGIGVGAVVRRRRCNSAGNAEVRGGSAMLVGGISVVRRAGGAVQGDQRGAAPSARLGRTSREVACLEHRTRTSCRPVPFSRESD